MRAIEKQTARPLPQAQGYALVRGSCQPDDPGLLVSDWLAAKSASTRRAYEGDLRRFGDWLGLSSLPEICRYLFAQGPSHARHTVLQYRLSLENRDLSPSTINRALATLRGLVELGRDCGLVDWSLRVKGLPTESYRDTRGPAQSAVGSILEAARTHGDPWVARRDSALLRLLYGLALRRSEAVSLDIGHVDLERGVVWVLGKGKRQRTPLSLPGCVAEALEAWLAEHPAPSDSTPLFVALDRSSRFQAKRLSSRSVARILKRACKAAGIRQYSPHALRHAAITAALDHSGGDYRAVRAFSRHKNVETVSIYDDHRRDGFGAIASSVAL